MINCEDIRQKQEALKFEIALTNPAGITFFPYLETKSLEELEAMDPILYGEFKFQIETYVLGRIFLKENCG